MLERDFNPGIRSTLAGLGEMARGDSEYWDSEIAALLPRVARRGKPSRSGRRVSGEAQTVVSLDIALLTALPIAVERQLLHHVSAELGGRLEFVHVEQLRRLAREGSAGKRLALPGGLAATRSFRELQLTLAENTAQLLSRSYSYPLTVPGEASVPELGSVIHARMIQAGEEANAAHHSGSLLNPLLLARELIVRNWRDGDRFFPAKTREPKKLKELLQPPRLGRPVPPEERKSWPVIESAGQIVWVRGFAVPEAFAASGSPAVLIEETQIEVRAR
jgi:tRNA(Ile)-lysidine synthetase-like protein